MGETDDTRATRESLIAEPFALPLDPLVIERRLFEIDVMSKSDFDSDAAYMYAVKSAIYRLRQDLVRAAKEAARG